MFPVALTFLLGICTPLLFSHLIPLSILIILLIIAITSAIIFYFKKHPALKLLTIFILGFFWFSVFSYYNAHWELAKNLEGQAVSVTGTIDSIPVDRGLSEGFDFDVQSITNPRSLTAGSTKKVKMDPAVKPREFDNRQTLNNEEYPNERITGKINLSWYQPYPVLKVGDEWQLNVKLKRPHGLSNPGVFDFDQSAFFNNIRAKGYVLKGQLVSSNPCHDIIGRWRQYFDGQVQKHLGADPMTGIIRAVTVGDKSAITQGQWAVFQRTGTNHLIAISGLHIGLVSGLFFVFVNFIWRCFPRLCLMMPSMRVAALAGMSAAMVYSALAGFAVPTQRALIMLLFFMGSIFLKKRLRPWHAWSSAMVVVLIINPLNVLSPGFWMSFIAVGGLIYGLSGRLKPTGLWWKFGRAQWVMSLAIMPVTIIVFQQASLIAPLANVLAIPWVGMIVVPLSLIACFSSFSQPLSSGLFFLAAKAMNGFWIVLACLSSLPEVAWLHAMPSVTILIFVVIGVLILLLPHGFNARWVGVFWILPLIFYQAPRPADNNFWLTLLDVGQGLSAVVETKNHVLVFDTGADYGDGFDMGAVVVVPYLRDKGIAHLDTLVVSHGDNDHIGGAHSLLLQFPARDIFTSVPDRFANMTSKSSVVQTCLAGQSWQWDGVNFKFLFPTSALLGLDNNSSCVLRVSDGSHSVLLTGDIEKEAEDYLVDNEHDDLHSEIIVAPHHGSITSSSPGFVAAVHPDVVLFPVGYRNKFNFPSGAVEDRYKALGAVSYDTATDGAILFDLRQGVAIGLPELYRKEHGRFWG